MKSLINSLDIVYQQKIGQQNISLLKDFYTEEREFFKSDLEVLKYFFQGEDIDIHLPTKTLLNQWKKNHTQKGWNINKISDTRQSFTSNNKIPIIIDNYIFEEEKKHRTHTEKQFLRQLRYMRRLEKEIEIVSQNLKILEIYNFNFDILNLDTLTYAEASFILLGFNPNPLHSEDGPDFDPLKYKGVECFSIIKFSEIPDAHWGKNGEFFLDWFFHIEKIISPNPLNPLKALSRKKEFFNNEIPTKDFINWAVEKGFIKKQNKKNNSNSNRQERPQTTQRNKEIRLRANILSKERNYNKSGLADLLSNEKFGGKKLNSETIRKILQ